jgi:glucose-1-phosphate thymidylyltransferase
LPLGATDRKEVHMKGIVLAGGKATQLYPITKGVSKQLLPIYDKPMIYYPLSVLMLAGIRDILIITTPESQSQFINLLGDGSEIGITITYAKQGEPRGLADAFIIGEDFIGQDKVALILGDNIFFGHGLSELLQEAAALKEGASIFGTYIRDPERSGVVEFDQDLNILSIEEKPEKPKSNWVIPGLYFFDNQVIDIAKNITPSHRGEIEITDVIKEYFSRQRLKLKLLGRGYAWLDTGTYASLIDASMFIKTIEDRQGLKIGCVQEIAFRQGYISKEQLLRIIQDIKTDYAEYLRQIIQECTI